MEKKRPVIESSKRKDGNLLLLVIIALLVIYGAWSGINTALTFFGIITFGGTGDWWAMQCGT